jgi:hypothetical protein
LLSAWHVTNRSACCNFCCRFFFRHNTFNALMLRATQLLRLYDICPDITTIASIAAFGCRNG